MKSKAGAKLRAPANRKSATKKARTKFVETIPVCKTCGYDAHGGRDAEDNKAERQANTEIMRGWLKGLVGLLMDLDGRYIHVPGRADIATRIERVVGSMNGLMRDPIEPPARSTTTHKVDPEGRAGDTEELHRVVLEAHEWAIAAHEVYGDFASMHEAYGVLAEEVAELFDGVRMRQTDTRRLPSIRAEALQVACVALRIAEQAGRSEGGVSR